MSWETTRNLGRSIICCGEQLRFFRKRAGLTQEQLADLSGYSDRLIRKAEAGKSVHPDTIEVLAETLSSDGTIVYPEDLVTSPAQIALSWGQAYRTKGKQLTVDYHKFLDEKVDVFMAGDPSQIPFAGTGVGIDFFDHIWHTFFQVFERHDLNGYQPQCTAEGNSAFTVARSRAYVRGTDIFADSWVLMRFQFERGRVVRFEDYFDTQGAASLFRQAAAREQQLASEEDSAEDAPGES